jgi:hypothetical protein
MPGHSQQDSSVSEKKCKNNIKICPLTFTHRQYTSIEYERAISKHFSLSEFIGFKKTFTDYPSIGSSYNTIRFSNQIKYYFFRYKPTKYNRGLYTMIAMDFYLDKNWPLSFSSGFGYQLFIKRFVINGNLSLDNNIYHGGFYGNGAALLLQGRFGIGYRF